MMMVSLAVFVDSYDGNSDLWENVFKVMNCYWPDTKYTRYLVTNQKSYDNYNVQSIQVGPDTEWVTCTLKGLEYIDEEYVFFLFDDQYFSKFVRDEQFERIVDTMRETDTFFYRLSPTFKMNRDSDYSVVPVSNPYVINLQPGIWRKEKLISILETLKMEGKNTPWEFEFYFLDAAKEGRLETESDHYKGVLYDTRDIMGYKNSIIQGKWDRGIVKYYKRHTDLDLDLGDRKVMPMSEFLWDRIKQSSYSFIPMKQRERIKTLLKRAHFKFMR